MTSAAFHFDAQASLVKKSVAASATTTATLDDTTGASTCAWEVIAAYNSVVGDWSLSTATGTSTVVTAPSGSGKSCLLQCKVNGGVYVDPVTGRQTAGGQTIRTAKIYIAPETIVTGETTESDSTNGWGPIVNAAIVATSTAGTPSVTSLTTKSLVVSDTDAQLTVSRTAANTVSMDIPTGDTLQARFNSNLQWRLNSSGTWIGSPNGFNSFEVQDAGISLSHAFGYVDITGGGSPGVTLNTTDSTSAISSANSALLRRAITGRVYKREFVYTTSTSDDSTSSAMVYTTTSNTVYGVTVYATVSNDTDNEGIVFAPRVNAYKNVAGVLSQVGATGVTTEGTDRADAIGTAALTLDTSGTDFRVRITGIAAKTLNWNIVLEITERVLA